MNIRELFFLKFEILMVCNDICFYKWRGIFLYLRACFLIIDLLRDYL